MGIYEEYMELQEMRQVIDALQISANESETNFFDSGMQHALRESELDFLPSTSGRVLNSTMMSIHTHSSPDSNANVVHSEKILVQAEVHHPMEWSPPNERLTRKRVASACMVIANENISTDLESNKELFEPVAKRCQDISLFNEMNNSDEKSTDSAEESAEISTKSLHEMHGPSSERKVHDSGFMLGHETPQSLLNNTTDSSPPSEHSALELTDNIHEIRGPVSVRRIHDSGFNISSEKSHTSVENNLLDNSVICLENSVQFSFISASDLDNAEGNSSL